MSIKRWLPAALLCSPHCPPQQGTAPEVLQLAPLLMTAGHHLYALASCVSSLEHLYVGGDLPAVFPGLQKFVPQEWFLTIVVK